MPHVHNMHCKDTRHFSDSVKINVDRGNLINARLQNT